MRQSALSTSDIIARPTSLTERLAAEASGEAPSAPEPTVSSMAERFAPGAPRVNEAPGRPMFEPPVMPGVMPAPVRRNSANRGLLAASILISLVPTAIILALLWQGAIRLPETEHATGDADYSQVAESLQASVTSAPMMEVAAKPDIALSAPSRIEAAEGAEVEFGIAVDSADALPARSIIAIRAMPEGASFNQGRPYGEAEWNVRPDEIGDLRLRLPKVATGRADLRIELMAADGTVLASAVTRLDVAPDPKSLLILRSDESGRIADLMAHGQKMIDVGYFAGARAYYKRAAEAGSGEAALRLGATYDPDFIEKIGAHGIKGDLKEARAWYERAKQLGVEGAEEKLDALKDEWTDHKEPAQGTEAGTAPQAVAEAEPAGGADASASRAAPPNAAAPVRAANAAVVAEKDAWVELSGFANVRVAPSSNAETIRIAEKGAKLRFTGRKGNWVQVTDPATAEVGWIYSRYIVTPPAP
jgi:SH3 domain-containing protein